MFTLPHSHDSHPSEPARSARASLGLVAGLVTALVAAPVALAQAPLPGSFVEVTKNPLAPDYSGINFEFKTSLPTLEMGMGGVACADYDNDGDTDIFFPNDAGFPNALYQNQGNGTFVDVAALVGVANPTFRGCQGLFFDYDNDGDLDLFVAAHANVPGGAPATPADLYRIFENNGAPNWNFTNVSSTAGFAHDPTTARKTEAGVLAGAAIGDYNRDGYLDIVVTYFAGANDADQMRLFRSRQNATQGPGIAKRTFIDVTKPAGLEVTPPITGDACAPNPPSMCPWEMWMPTFLDLNRDGWPDIHINVDFGHDLYMLNQQDGTFIDVGTAVGLNGNPTSDKHEMGLGVGDYDNDGDLDLHATNILNEDRHYRNDTVGGVLSFANVEQIIGTNNSVFGWGDLFFDFDNDGDLDHTTVSGFTGTNYVNTFHLNLFPAKAGDGITVLMQDRTADLPDYTKFGQSDWRSGRGLSQLDYDNDGDIDLVMTCTNKNNPKAGLFKNTLSSSSGWLKVELREMGGSRNVVGARVTIQANGVRQTREVITGSSFLSQEPDVLHYGLGSATNVDWVCVRWADGKMSVLQNLAPNQKIGIRKRTTGFALGDMDGNGVLNCNDLTWWDTFVAHPLFYQGTFGTYPADQVGDIDGNGVIDAADRALLQTLTGC